MTFQKCLDKARDLAGKQMLLLLALGAFSVAQAADSDDKTFYYLGTAIYKNLEMLNLTSDEAEKVLEGLEDAMKGKAEELDDAIYGAQVREMTQQRMLAAAELEQQAGLDFVAEMAAQEGAVQTASGMVYQEVQAGSGQQPTSTSNVRAHYKGTLRDGSVFDSSYARGEPLVIGLNQVIPCWTEGIAMMKEGGKAVLVCPSEMAYGPRGQGGIPPNAALVFEVELIEIVD